VTKLNWEERWAEGKVGGRLRDFDGNSSPIFAEEMCFLLWHYRFILATVAEFLRHVKDYEQKLLSETDGWSTLIWLWQRHWYWHTHQHWQWTWQRPCYCVLYKWEPSSCSVKTVGYLEFWCWPSFHWRSQWIEDVSASVCTRILHLFHSSSPPLHGSDPDVGGRD